MGQSLKPKGGLEMDSSNRLKELEEKEGRRPSAEIRFVLGETTPIDLRMVSLEERLLPLEIVVGLVGPLTKYIPEFKPLGESLNKWLGGEAHRITDQGIATFPPDMSERTKALWIAEVATARTDESAICKELFLAEDGQLLLWAATYSLRPVGRHGSKSMVAMKSCFEVLTLKDLSDRISQPHWFPGERIEWHDLSLQVLARLHRALRSAIEKREEYLKNMQRVEQQVDRILSRIHFPSGR